MKIKQLIQNKKVGEIIFYIIIGIITVFILSQWSSCNQKQQKEECKSNCSSCYNFNNCWDCYSDYNCKL